MSIRQRSLFDVEDETLMPKVRDMTVSKVSTADVTEFAARYHYAITGGNMSWCWGLWDGVILHGVVAYNLPTRPACAAVFGVEHVNHVWHMGRLICSDASPRNSESRLIGGSLKAIRREYPDVWAILTFASAKQNHVGYVYQATNALYAGVTTRKHHYLDQGGQYRSQKQGRNLNIGDALRRGWRVEYEPAKHRYIYLLGSRSQRRTSRELLRYPVLPYPKSVGLEDESR